MKLAWQRFKFLGIAVFVLLIIVPLLVFAEGNYSSGFQLLSGATRILDLTAIGAGKTCVTNNSGSAYFLPTRTYNPEWLSVLTAAPRLGLTFPSCCGDGICNGSENCSNCGDCGVCVCSSFTYSNWSGCSGGIQTRIVIAATPANCTGGNPVTSQSCSCTLPGCSSGTCRNSTIYLSANNCTGGSIPQYNVCASATTPNYSCVVGGPSNSVFFVPASGCTQSVACNTPGCPGGSSCRTAYPYLGTPDCTGSTSGPLYSTCVTDAQPSNSCINMNSITSVRFVPGSGCSY